MRTFPPAWVYGTGYLLALVAGSVNAVSWLGVGHKGITHITGALTEVSTRAVAGDPDGALHGALVVLAFMLGALLSGVLIGGDATLRLGRRYGVGMVIEGGLLVVAFLVRGRGQWLWSDYLAAAACGLQNALVTGFSGAVLRTTHMTGVVTDLGLLLGHAVRGQGMDWWRLCLYLALLGGFGSGGALGALANDRVGAAALLFPAAAVSLAGVSYWVWIALRRASAR